MVLWLISILGPCYFGTELTIASSKLSTALYKSAWLEGDRTLRNNMKIFMENAKDEIKFSAFGLFNVNLETFITIVNAAYSLFAVLKSVNI